MIQFLPDDLRYQDRYVTINIKGGDVWQIYSLVKWTSEEAYEYKKLVDSKFDWPAIMKLYEEYEKHIYEPQGYPQHKKLIEVRKLI